MALSGDEGRAVVELARRTIDAHVEGTRTDPAPSPQGVMAEERGVFVTLNAIEGSPDRLRGCIGFPYPVKKLALAIREAAVAAATEDPRFLPVAKGELDRIVVEVSVLSVPTPLVVHNRKDAPSKVRIGTDGLIVSRTYASGLLLPQVATEFGLDGAEFLSQACMKAGLAPDAWLDPDTEIQVFQAEVFSESKPHGPVVRHQS